MGWNAGNPVPWKRLTKEWAVIGVVVALVSLLLFENRSAANYLTILFGGAVYVVLGAVLAKFGYQRKTLKQIREEAAAMPPRQVGRSAPLRGAARPAPTSRTGGAARRPQSKRRK